MTNYEYLINYFKTVFTTYQNELVETDEQSNAIRVWNDDHIDELSQYLSLDKIQTKRMINAVALKIEQDYNTFCNTGVKAEHLNNCTFLGL